MGLKELLGVEGFFNEVTEGDIQWLIERMEANRIETRKVGFYTMKRINHAEEMIVAAINAGNREALYCSLKYLMDSCELSARTSEWERLSKYCLERLESKEREKEEKS